MYKFKCFSCQKQSQYLRRVGALRLELKKIESQGETERTYECEHCGTENQITNSELQWMAIDLGAGQR